MLISSSLVNYNGAHQDEGKIVEHPQKVRSVDRVLKSGSMQTHHIVVPAMRSSWTLSQLFGDLLSESALPSQTIHILASLMHNPPCYNLYLW